MSNKLYLFLAICGLLSACSSKSIDVTPTGLTGTWIEKANRKDTLVFNSAISLGFSDGNLLVKRAGPMSTVVGGGFYAFYIKDKTIYVRNWLSSNSMHTGYPISQTQHELKVGNFFEVGFNKPHTAVRKFVRL
jgi:hypothetical protein